MEITKDKILEVLGNVLEPDLKKDLVTLNLIEDIQINGNKIELLINIYNTALHAKKRMQEAVDFNLKQVFGNDIEVVSTIKGMPKETKKDHRKILPEVKNIIAVATPDAVLVAHKNMVQEIKRVTSFLKKKSILFLLLSIKLSSTTPPNERALNQVVDTILEFELLYIFLYRFLIYSK